MSNSVKNYPELIRSKNEFEWKVRLGTDAMGKQIPNPAISTRKPLLWLQRAGSYLVFVNSSDQMLKRVAANFGGFFSADKDNATVSSNRADYCYDDVKPGEAVVIEEYDGRDDLDFVLETFITVTKLDGQVVKYRSPPGKGGMKDRAALEWPDNS